MKLKITARTTDKFTPRTPSQKQLSIHLKDDKTKLVVAIGPAGVGKTYMSVQHAISNFIKKDIDKIIITRPIVSMGEELGYLPGDIKSKMHPWLIPIYDGFKEYLTVDSLNSYISNGEIEICPLAYIRGRTFHNCMMIADEVQNTTKLEMKTLLTRMGENSKLILTGDLMQSDIKGVNGLQDFLQKYTSSISDGKHDYGDIGVVHFDTSEVVRSELVKHVLEIYDQSEV
jgi:phosphate starvation-inducible PhoH-like protein